MLERCVDAEPLIGWPDPALATNMAG